MSQPCSPWEVGRRWRSGPPRLPRAWALVDWRTVFRAEPCEGDVTAPEVRIVKDPSAIAEAGALEVVERADRAIGARGRFTLVLAGGQTPRLLYERLGTGGSPPYRERI